ncbi:MAG: TlpA family protein disulfide reductase [Gemmatimonadaceae bacterium]
MSASPGPTTRRVPVTLAVLAVAMLAACGGADHGSDAAAASGGGERFRPLAVGAPAPAYAVRTLDGDTVRVGAGAVPADGAGTVTLLNVWATWCGPCRREFPELERLHRAHAPRGLRIVAVSIDLGDDAPVAAFAREHGATFTIGRDVSGTVQDRYQSMGVPESYLIGADGTLLWRHVGELPANDPSLRSALERAGL